MSRLYLDEPYDFNPDVRDELIKALLECGCLQQFQLGEDLTLPSVWFPKRFDVTTGAARLARCQRTTVGLSHNGLRSLPEILSATITSLDLSHNALSSVPKGLSRCLALRVLHLENNHLSILPPFLGALKELETLKVGGNPLEGDLGRLRDDEAILRYLRELNKSSVPVRNVQVITLGHQMVGKSTLLLALHTALKWMGKTKVPALDRTVEVMFSDVVRKGFRWRFRDLPGQAEYYATNARFLTADTAILLLVFDITNTEQREHTILQWSSVVRRLTCSRGQLENSRVLLVATHLDKIPAASRSAEMEWLDSFCRREIPEVKFVRILGLDATTAEDVHSALWPVLRQCAKELTRDKKIPKFVEDIRAKLRERKEASRRNWTTYKDFLADLQTSEFGLAEADARFAISILRSMGDVLVLEDHTIVLNPAWLSRLTAETVKPAGRPFYGMAMNNGVANYSSLAKMLAGDRSALLDDAKEVPVALKLLQQLDVLFPLARDQWKLADEKTEFLVPSRLVITALSRCVISFL